MNTPNPPTPVMYVVQYKASFGWTKSIEVNFVAEPIHWIATYQPPAVHRFYRFLHPSGSLHFVRDGKLVEICEHGREVGYLCWDCAVSSYPGRQAIARSCARPLSEQQPEEVKPCASMKPQQVIHSTVDAQSAEDASSGAVRSEPASAPESGTPITDAVWNQIEGDAMTSWRAKAHAMRDCHATLERKLAESEKELREVTKHHDGQTEFWYNRNKEQTDKLTAANLRAERAVVALDKMTNIADSFRLYGDDVTEVKKARAVLAEHPETLALADGVKEMERINAVITNDRDCYFNKAAKLRNERDAALAQLDAAQVAMSILDSAAKLLTAQGRPCSAEEVARLIAESVPREKVEELRKAATAVYDALWSGGIYNEKALRLNAAIAASAPTT